MMKIFRPIGAFALVITMVLAATACQEAVVRPTLENVAGEYVATEINRLEHGETTADLLAEGASLELRLDPDGTFSGNILIPEWEGAPIENDALRGTWWTREGTRTVHLEIAEEPLLDGFFFVTHEPGEMWKTNTSDQELQLWARVVRR